MYVRERVGVRECAEDVAHVRAGKVLCRQADEEAVKRVRMGKVGLVQDVVIV
jgi:hypothetical protein